MSHFIALSQRIKLIETIKKTTSAMRLISMSLRIRLRQQKTILDEYTAVVEQLYHEVKPETSMTPHTTISKNSTIILLIGSQKGLCGTFNEHLFQFFNKQKELQGIPNIITLGNYATEFIKSRGITPLHAFHDFAPSNFTKVVSQLMSAIVPLHKEQLIVVSNQAKSLFLQKPMLTTLTLTEPEHSTQQYLAHLRIKTTLILLVYESLLAEQAARFLSMDVAYRNAEDLLAQTKLDYNKARQAHVTRELLELSGGMT